ncbi:methyltransferase, FkbM family [Verrucomicrobium sp. GAS474]|nr:methyltransferase, FkbM family [Verrucomicrobium sp. GAS474]
MQTVPAFHASTTPLYSFYKTVALAETKPLFSEGQSESVSFGPFGEIFLPYFKMGAIDTVDLFGLDELIIFAYYWANRARYKKALDIGANMGLHSILLDRCGIATTAFEPDPIHFKKLISNLKLNQATQVTPIEKAISTQSGETEFIRVKGNTTSSHIAGAKENPYGELDRFPVKIEAIAAIIEGIDLIKMDAEGHEKEILLGIPPAAWDRLDALVEINDVANAHAVFDHFQRLGVHLFAQKLNWAPVTTAAEMPIGHRGGTLCITRKPHLNWE